MNDLSDGAAAKSSCSKEGGCHNEQNYMCGHESAKDRMWQSKNGARVLGPIAN
jgi:hypothetical protein